MKYCNKALQAPGNGTKSSNSSGCNTTVFFSCDSCFHLVGNTQVICQRDHQWSGIEPICERRACCCIFARSNISCTLLCSSSAAYVDSNNEDTSTIDPKDIIVTIGSSDPFFLVQNVTLLSVVGFGPEVVSGLLEYMKLWYGFCCFLFKEWTSLEIRRHTPPGVDEFIESVSISLLVM